MNNKIIITGCDNGNFDVNSGNELSSVSSCHLEAASELEISEISDVLYRCEVSDNLSVVNGVFTNLKNFLVGAGLRETENGFTSYDNYHNAEFKAGIVTKQSNGQTYSIGGCLSEDFSMEFIVDCYTKRSVTFLGKKSDLVDEELSNELFNSSVEIIKENEKFVTERINLKITDPSQDSVVFEGCLNSAVYRIGGDVRVSGDMSSPDGYGPVFIYDNATFIEIMANDEEDLHSKLINIEEMKELGVELSVCSKNGDRFIITSNKAYMYNAKDQHGLSIGKSGWVIGFKTGDKFRDFDGEKYEISVQISE